MKVNHAKYDNRLTALYEQWLAGEKIGADAGASSKAPNSAFSPLYGVDVDMSTLASVENEYQIDINPLNTMFAIGSSTDGGTAGVGIYRTSDGGLTWISVDASVYGVTAACCDPAVAYASDGSVYVGILDTSPAGQYTLYSTDNGATFVNRGLLPLPDRNNIATDPSNPNIVYTTYSDLPATNRIKGYRSTDRGVTWSTSFFVGDAGQPSGYQQSSQPQVASNGTLYVGYQEYINSGAGCSAGVNNEVARSTDGGATFTHTSFPIVQGGACTSAQAGRGIFCVNTGGSSFRSRSFPVLAIHPTNPNIVYLNYTGGDLETAYTCGTATGFHSDMLFRKSTDGGATFSAPTKINDDPQGKDQYYGWIDVAPNGTLWAGWHDRREDANNFLHRWYQASSTDQGATWRKLDGAVGNDPVADVTSLPSTFIGDYAGIAAKNDRVLGMWWDARGDPYTDPQVPPAQGTPTPTATGTQSTASPTRTATLTPIATATSCATGNYNIVVAAATIVPGTTNIGSVCDDCVTDVTIPFPFTLYDQTFTQVGLDSNGKAHFPTGASVFTNTCLPGAGMTYTIFPYWDDQRTDVGTGVGIFTSTSGTAPNRIFNIEWRTTYFSGGGTANYELRLYEAAPSRFEVIFGVVTQGNASATGGVQKNSTLFLQDFCNGVGTPTTGSRLYTLSGGGCPTGTPATATRTATTGIVSPTATCAPGGGPIVFNGSLATTDPTLATRMFRADPASTCAAPHVCPGPSGTGPFYYDTYTFTNTTGASACVNINLDPMTCTGTPFIHASAYLGAFDPTNVCTSNYLGDIGASPTTPKDFSVTVPAGGQVTLVVNAVTAGTGGACPGYQLTVTGAGGGGCASVTPATATRTATPLITSTAPPPPPTTSISTSTATTTSTSTVVPPTATSTVCPIQFSDVPSTNTFYANIRCLACRGIVSGYSDGTFRPNNQVTRGQLAKMVSNSAGFSEDPNPQIFQDVPPTQTFYDFINRLTRRGHMTGYVCGGPGEPCIPPGNMPYFRPQANATRGQTSKIVSNAAGFTEPPVGQTFEDVPPTHTFYDFIQRLASRNVMQGYPCGGPFEPCVPPGNRPYFRPGNDVTRGQSAKIVANTFFPGCDPAVRP